MGGLWVVKAWYFVWRGEVVDNRVVREVGLGLFLGVFGPKVVVLVVGDRNGARV